MTVAHIDFETRSAADLKKTGAYAYAAHPTTDIWCMAYAIGDEPIKVWTPKLESPTDLIEHILTGGVMVAHNAAFERVIWRYILAPRYGFPEPDVTQWRCTMSMAYAMGLPGSLEMAAPAAGIDIAKDMTGRRLMLQMARPRKILDPKKFDEAHANYRSHPLWRTDSNSVLKREQWANAMRSQITWWDDPEKLAKLIAYCKQDVEVERALEKRLRPLSDSEQSLWHLDQIVNDRGVLVDEALANAAKQIVGQAQQNLDARMRELTNLAVSRCSNRNQLVAWVREQGVECESINKAALEELLADDNPLPAHVREVLLIRQESAKASVAKIDALLNGKSPEDNRAKGLLQFHAASTGRWGGRRFQPQNLRRPEEADIDTVIDVVATGDYDMVSMLYDKPLSAVADTLRGMLVAAPGHKIVAADYSNIEGRVLAWLAGEHWKLDAFRAFDNGTGHDLYKITAGGILNKRPEDVTKDERQSHGKVPELALGYQGGVGAFSTMAANYGLDLPVVQIEAIRDGWREKHPAIKRFWYAMEEAAIAAAKDKGSVQRVGRIAFKQAGSFLFMRLPSGRFLSYPYPEVRRFSVPWRRKEPVWVDCSCVEEGNFLYGNDMIEFDPVRRKALVCVQDEKDGLTYFTTIDVSKKSKMVNDPKNGGSWARIKTYGGMLVENATQAVARDVLADAMPRLEAAGYPVILTVHDEVVCEVPEGNGSVSEMEEIMCDLPSWAAGLPIAAEGFEGARYRK